MSNNLSINEKAIELYSKFQAYYTDFEAKKCAIICVDEVTKALEEYDERIEKYLKQEFGLEYFSVEKQNMDSSFRYWEKVKKELELL